MSGTIDERLARLTPARLAALAERLGPAASTAPTTPSSPRPPRHLVAYCARRGDAIDLAALDEHLRARLPEHMIPRLWVVLDALPRLPNGKIDHRRLPAPRSTRGTAPDARGGAGVAAAVADGADDETAAAAVRLCALLGELLGIDDVRPEDNFFELGGDSITAIQFVARAREAGLALELGSITEHDDIAAIAAAARGDSAEAAPVAAASGPVPLTPIQAWFLSHGHPDPAHWNQCERYAVVAELAATTLERAVREAIARHVGLGTRFVRDADRWQAVVPDGAAPPTTVRVLPFDATLGDAGVDAALDAAQREFALADGWLLRVLIFADDDGRARRLAWIAHHLVIDYISAERLLAEIEHGCADGRGDGSAEGRSRAQEPPALPIRHWAIALAERAREPDETGRRVGGPAQGAPATFATEADCDEHAMTIPTDEAAALLGVASATRVQERLLTALCLALREAFACERLGLDVESHGRDLLDGLDGSGTIGWLTSFFPVTVTLPPSRDAAGALETVAAAVAEAKRNGRWHLLRHYADASPLPRPPMPPGDHPSVLFNYLGGGGTGRVGGTSFAPLGSGDVALRSPRNLRPHAIEINATLADGRMVLRWRCARTVVDAERQRALLGAMRSALLGVAAACRAGDVATYRADDFPESGMDDEQLERFLADLD